jgi:hypothetical protein
MFTEILPSLAFLAVILVLRWFGIIPRVEVWRPKWYQRLRLRMRLRRLKRLENQPTWKHRQPRPRWAVWTMVALVSAMGVRFIALRRHPSIETAQNDKPNETVAQPAARWKTIRLVTMRSESAPSGVYIVTVRPFHGVGDNWKGLEHEFRLNCDKKRRDCAMLQLGQTYKFDVLLPHDPRGYQDTPVNLLGVDSFYSVGPSQPIFAAIDPPESVFNLPEHAPKAGEDIFEQVIREDKELEEQRRSVIDASTLHEMNDSYISDYLVTQTGNIDGFVYADVHLLRIDGRPPETYPQDALVDMTLKCDSHRNNCKSNLAKGDVLTVVSIDENSGYNSSFCYQDTGLCVMQADIRQAAVFGMYGSIEDGVAAWAMYKKEHNLSTETYRVQ